jgi:flavorubredoxin
MSKELKSIVELAKWEIRESLEFVGSPKEEDLKKGEALGRNFAQLIKQSG